MVLMSLSLLCAVLVQALLRGAVRLGRLEHGNMLLVTNIVLLGTFVLLSVLYLGELFLPDWERLAEAKRILMPFYFVHLVMHLKENLTYFQWKSR